MPTVNFGQRSVDSLREVHALSGNNVGNFIHTEAMPRILDYDAAGSAMLDLNGAVRLRGADRVADVISERYDALVFSCANLIKPKVNIPAEIEVLRKLKIPVVIIGAGIQEEMQEGLPITNVKRRPSRSDAAFTASRRSSKPSVRFDTDAATPVGPRYVPWTFRICSAHSPVVTPALAAAMEAGMILSPDCAARRRSCRAVCTAAASRSARQAFKRLI